MSSDSGPSTSPRSNGYATGRARRRVIVQTAAEHFAVSGFNGATIRDIAAAVGISRAGLLRHFGSKESLLQAVLEERDARDRQFFSQYTGVAGGVGILQGMIDLARTNERTPGIINLFIRLSTEAADPTHPAHEYFRERYRSIRTGTARVLQAAADEGYLRPGVEPMEGAIHLTAAMDGLQTQWALDPELGMHTHMKTIILGMLNDRGSQALEQLPSSSQQTRPALAAAAPE
ncbi:TetR/AcrR family transcriptional regulator [Nakamurella sp. GG22]